ncbi:MAG TPA: YncE family protein [Usitatibacter sp.]|nr:YncE family protein [Usitatibacter sp.]
MLLRIACFLACLAAALCNAQGVIATATTPDAADVAVNPRTHAIYVAGDSNNVVYVINPATFAVRAVPTGRGPQYLAIDSATNRIYVSNERDASLSIIDGVTLAVTTLPIGGSGPIAVDEAADRAYVMRRGNNGEVTVLDGAGAWWYAIDTGSYVPQYMALDSAAHRLFVSHSVSGDVRSIDLTSASDTPPTVSIQVAGQPTYLALDAGAHRLYVESNDAREPLVAIDTANSAKLASITTPGHSGEPNGVAINPATHRVYAAFGSEVVVVDPPGDVVGYVETGPIANLVADPGLNKVYGVADNALVVIDGATNAVTQVPLPDFAWALALDPGTHRLFAAGDTTAIIDATSGTGSVLPPAFADNVQGLWWAAPAGAEPDWGIEIAQQGNTLMAGWFTYDTDGSALWLIIPNAVNTGGNTYSGSVYRTTGPPFTGAFDPTKVAATPVGIATFSFTDGDNGTFSASIGGAQVGKPITRQVFGPVPACTAGGFPGPQPNYTDIWWESPAGSESGWGLFITHQGDNLFIAWFTYDVDGRPLWLVGSNIAKTGNGSYSGALYQTRGPAWNAVPWNGAAASVQPVGSATLVFSDPSNATFTYSALGASGSKSLTREAFSAPATVCR